jgi:G3E family GTPase
MRIPVTVFTGFLGSGKTTIIINLINQLPRNYKLVMLKNEFGNVAVDSKLAAESNLQVTEMLNGCLCCILVGKLGNALDEILNKYSPDRIIIETSGSAYPAPIAWEIRKMSDRLKLDGIITVIDAVNFPGYRDNSYTAKIQAQFTDLILINKHELVSESKLDHLLDDVYDLNPSTPKIKTDRGFIDKQLIFGIDTKLFRSLRSVQDEQFLIDPDHEHNEVQLMEMHSKKIFDKKNVESVLAGLPKWDFYRIKGYLNFNGSTYLINYAFGNWEFTRLSKQEPESALIFMGKNFHFHFRKVQGALKLDPEEIKMLD